MADTKEKTIAVTDDVLSSVIAGMPQLHIDGSVAANGHQQRFRLEMDFNGSTLRDVFGWAMADRKITVVNGTLRPAVGRGEFADETDDPCGWYVNVADIGTRETDPAKRARSAVAQLDDDTRRTVLAEELQKLGIDPDNVFPTNTGA